MKLRFGTDGGTDAQHGDIEALADARRALKKYNVSWPSDAILNVAFKKLF